MTLAARLAEAVDALRTDQRVLVAFDGPDAAGKTTLARQVGAQLRRPAVCASIDDWHNPHDVRLSRGHESPEGYYLDSFDLDALVRDCLQPFASGASQVTTVSFDHRVDRQADARQDVAPDAALLFDGVFLLRPELRSLWDLSIYLHVPESVTLARAEERDQEIFGSAAEVRRRYERRYLPGQALYREHAGPLHAADILVDNSDAMRPVTLRWCSGG